MKKLTGLLLVALALVGLGCASTCPPCVPTIEYREKVVPVVQAPPLPDVQDVELKLPVALVQVASLPPAMAWMRLLTALRDDHAELLRCHTEASVYLTLLAQWRAEHPPSALRH